MAKPLWQRLFISLAAGLAGAASIERLFLLVCLALYGVAYVNVGEMQASPTDGALARAYVSGTGSGSGSGTVTRTAAATTTRTADNTWFLTDERGRELAPTAIVSAGSDFFLLGTSNVWRIPNALEAMSRSQVLKCENLGPVGGRIGKFPIQEFNNFAFAPDTNSLVVLDKSGDIWDYSLSTHQWNVCRPNKPITGQPDPDFIDLATTGSGVVLLDPERNEIWSFACGKNITRWWDEVMPWRVKPGQPNVGDAINIAYDRDAFVLKRSGAITRYGAGSASVRAVQKHFAFRRPPKMRPSRLMTGPGVPLYIVERENNRVLAVDKTSGRVSQFIFPGYSDLRGLQPGSEGFYLIDGVRLVYRSLSQPDPPSKPLHPRRIDPRLDGLMLPVTGVRLPRHPGVWPGARRLYRYGVHQGVDFFDDRGCSAKVVMGTPARAADGGKVVRVDCNFVDMDLAKFNRVMKQCLVEHNTSDANEDLLRGCQVWIDHGKGLLTKYAHLDKTRDGLRTGTYIVGGDIVGDIGVSGTGQNLPGRGKHPHLHFEIWLDGHYLGWGYTPAETIGIYEDIFGTSCEGN